MDTRCENGVWLVIRDESGEIIVGSSEVVIKVATKKDGQPCREPVLSERDEKLLLMHSAKRREELQQLSTDADDSFYDAPWADQNGLKRKVLGLDNISWRP